MRYKQRRQLIEKPDMCNRLASLFRPDLEVSRARPFMWYLLNEFCWEEHEL